MAKSVKTIRKIKPSKIVDFDDQLWSINVAILILAGFIAGIVIGKSDFDDSRLLYNGWVHLLGVAVWAAVAFAAVFYLQGKVRRRVLLCVVLSLLAHSVLVTHLYHTYMVYIAQEKKDRRKNAADDRPPVVVRDYNWRQIERPKAQQDYEKPMESEAPKPTDPQAVRQQADPIELPTEVEPVEEPEVPQRQQPNPAVMQRPDLSAPRRAEAAGGLSVSRKQWKPRQLPSPVIPEPEIRPQSPQAATVPQEGITPRQRETAEVRIAQQQAFEQLPADVRPTPKVAMARDANRAEPIPDRPATPTPMRRVNPAADFVRSRSPAMEPVRPRQPAPAPAAPNSLAQSSARRDAATPRAAPVSPETTPEPAAPRTATAANANQRTSPQNPRMAQAPRVAPSRQQNRVAIPADTAQPQPDTLAAQTPAGPVESSVTPNRPTSTAARTRAESPTGSQDAAPGAAEPAIGASAVVARAGQRRAAGTARLSATDSGTARGATRAATAAPAIAASGTPELSSAVGQVASQIPGPAVPSSNARAPVAQRGGAVQPFAPEASTGAGPTGSSGTSGAVGVTSRNRVTRYESNPSGLAGGGTPRPQRSSGGATTTNAIAETSTPKTTAPSGQNKPGPTAMTAQLGGARTEASGSPGSNAAQPIAGSPEAQLTDGTPLSAAMARRELASQNQPGGRDVAAARNVTMQRSNAGAELPIANISVDDPPGSGAGGVSVAQDSPPSALPQGSNAAVVRATGSLTPAQATAAESGSDAAMAGGQSVVVAAGAAERVTRDDNASLTAAANVRTGPRRGTGRLSLPSGDSPDPMLVSTTTPTTSNSPQATGPSSAATNGARRTAGMSRDTSDSSAVETAMESGPTAFTPGTVAGQRRVASGDMPGPSMAAEVGRAPRRNTAAPGLLAAIGEVTPEQPTASAMPSGSGDVMELAAGIDVGEPSRQAAGLTVQISAPAGPGGMSFDPSPAVGINSRRASRESETVHSVDQRFLTPKSGGLAAIDGQYREQPAEAFRHRDLGKRADNAQAHGGTEGTEIAIESGLDFFARTQFPDGHWSLHQLPKEAGFEDADGLGTMNSDTAATGLALLSYLGAAYTHQDDKHQAVVAHGINWLVHHQKENGDLYTGGSDATWFYSHTIATIALCEAYGMTRDAELREPARKAVDFLLKTQDPRRGGWRYYLDDKGASTETDTSVTGWGLMALKSAQMAGLDVPKPALEKIDGWLDTAKAASPSGQYVYNPHAGNTREQRDGRKPSLAMTAEAMLMRMYLGSERDDPQLLAGAGYLRENLPAVGTQRRSLRDCYYWYYATQAMYHLQGEHWAAWYGRLHPMALGSQEMTGPTAGSWHPKRPVTDRWGHAGGRHYVTAMHLLMLEVFHRYLPLYKELGQ